MVNEHFRDRLIKTAKNLTKILHSKYYFFNECNSQFVARFKSFSGSLTIDFEYYLEYNKFSISQIINFGEEANDKHFESNMVYNLMRWKEYEECENFIKELINNNSQKYFDSNGKIVINNIYQYENHNNIPVDEVKNNKIMLENMIHNASCIINSPLMFEFDHHFEKQYFDDIAKKGYSFNRLSFEVRSKRHPVQCNKPAILIACDDLKKFRIYLRKDTDCMEDKGDKEFENYDDAFKWIKYLNEKYMKNEVNYFDGI